MSEQIAVDVVGCTIRALVDGDGPMVVFLHHSFGGYGWAPLHQSLSVDHRVVVPMLPGFGASSRPDWARDVRDLALLMGGLLRRLGSGPVALVGAGLGGWVAAELATMAPERLSHLVLIGAAGILPREGRITDQMLVSHVAYLADVFGDTGAYDTYVGAAPSDDTLVEWEANREMVARVTWRPYMYNRRLEPLLADVTVPTLVVWGSDDRVVPFECARRYAALLPNARLVTLDGGHAIDLERPEDVAVVVRAHLSGAGA